MSYTRKLVYEPLRFIDSSTFTGSYQAIGGPLLHAGAIVKLVNNSNVLVLASVDGVNDYDVAPSNSFFLYDVTANHTTEYGSTFVPQGTQYYVKGPASSGLVYLVIQYIIQA